MAVGPTRLHRLALALLLVVVWKPGLCSIPQTLKVLAARNRLDSHITIQHGLGWRDCRPSAVLKPTSTDQLADAITAVYQDAVAHGERYTVRAVNQHFLTHNNFSCPEATTGHVAVHAVSVDMSDMKEVLAIHEDTITVQAGITIQALEAALLDHGRSLPGIILVPHLAEMTLGAALMTASHGSSLVGPASLAPYITKAVLVDGTGQVHALDSPGDLLEGSLGMLGIVTEITLLTMPAVKVAVKQLQEEDFEIVGDLRDIIEHSEAVSLDVTWSPAAGMYVVRVWHETEPSSYGDARNTWMHGSREWLTKMNRKLQADQEDLRDKTGTICQLLGDVVNMPHFSPNDENPDSPESDEEQSNDHGVGPESNSGGISVGWLNRMASASCPEGGNCFWKQAKWTPYELSISSEDFADWVADVKAIMSHATGCPSFLFTFRFVMESDAPMAMNAGRQVVAIEISTHSGRGSAMPVKYQGLFEEIVQMTLCKYGARPHWAFGTNRMFVGPCPIRETLGGDLDAFLEQQHKYDPLGLFVPPLFSAIMNRSIGSLYPGCAVEGDCYCQENSHCGPRHKCVPGVVFKEYNVCVAEDMITARGGEL